MFTSKSKILLGIGTALLCTAAVNASSHREAPFITQSPKVDGTDFYMFTSYEAGRADFVTLLANYVPLQDGYGGPNYFTMDDDAIYEIHIDNNADAVEDITFQFKFDTVVKGITLNVGGVDVAIPLSQAGGVGSTAADNGNLNVTEFFTVDMISGDRRSGTRAAVSASSDGATTFAKPVDNIGNKTIPDYKAYADDHIYNVAIPGCGTGRLFVGQRKEGFVVNLGETFDLINTNPLGPANGEENTLADKNVTTLALEVQKSCLTNGSDIIGAWTTASKRQARVLNPRPDKNKKGSAIHGGAYTQVSRLGSPLVNEVVIGLPDKDLFNHSEPKDDGQFATYVTNPTLPALIEILFPSAVAPTSFPRADLVAAFLTGVDGLNQPAGVVGSEMLRLNTATAPVAAANQKPLTVLDGDAAGFPNGRRPGDDVVDIALRVVMGVLLPVTDAPAGQLPFTDGAYVDALQFDEVFPYLKTPLPGSPN